MSPRAFLLALVLLSAGSARAQDAAAPAPEAAAPAEEGSQPAWVPWALTLGASGAGVVAVVGFGTAALATLGFLAFGVSAMMGGAPVALTTALLVMAGGSASVAAGCAAVVGSLMWARVSMQQAGLWRSPSEWVKARLAEQFPALAAL